jgi:sucrose phosphorylase
LSAVTRPRSLPLLSEFPTRRGPRHVWTTFSADQVDLNFAEPEVLRAMTEVLLQYVQQGARIIRLDAIAYLWKQIGTSCIHLPQTHAVVKFLRELLAGTAPGVLLLTETNVPHAENISYFGDGDEAHLVYQFSLPPLVLDAWLNEDARPLVRWLAELAPAPPGATFLNFTASHDGIGVRPLEGLVPVERFLRLADTIRARGGMISTRHGPDGRDLPYELNVTYFDAVTEPGSRDTDLQVRRYLGTQALMLALRGIPAVYFSSLFGAGNDVAGAQQSGQARRINRRKFSSDELNTALGRPESREARVLAGYRRLLAVRRAQPAFHPDADQQVWPDVPAWLVAVLRTSLDGRQRLLTLVNVSGQEQSWEIPADLGFHPAQELISGRSWPQAAGVQFGPYETVWLASTT